MWAARKKDSLLALSSCCPPSVRVALPSTPLHTYQFPGLGTNLSNLLQQITAPAHSAHPVQGQHIQHLLHRLLLEPEFRQETKGQGGESCLLGAGPPICTGFLEPRRLGTRWRAPTLADAPCSQQREHSLLAGFSALSGPSRANISQESASWTYIQSLLQLIWGLSVIPQGLRVACSRSLKLQPTYPSLSASLVS